MTDPNDTEKSPVEQAVETLVFAPIGLLFEGSSILPQLVDKGRSQVAMARMIGQFAVKQGRSEAEKAAGRLQERAAGVLELIGGTLGASPAIHDVEPPPPPAEPLPEVAPEAHELAPSGPKPPPRRGPSAAKAAARNTALGGTARSSAATAPTEPAKPAEPAEPAEPARVAKSTRAPKAAAARKSATPAAAAMADVIEARVDAPVAETPVPGVGDLAIPDYDGLSASHVVNRLAGLTTDELEAVRRYEAANRGRKTILSKVAQLQSA